MCIVRVQHVLIGKIANDGWCTDFTVFCRKLIQLYCTAQIQIIHFFCCFIPFHSIFNVQLKEIVRKFMWKTHILCAVKYTDAYIELPTNCKIELQMTQSIAILKGECSTIEYNHVLMVLNNGFNSKLFSFTSGWSFEEPHYATYTNGIQFTRVIIYRINI